jgi:EAL domain-containing protein (putative c-di-GMP-specific phosphodiesterase class I)
MLDHADLALADISDSRNELISWYRPSLMERKLKDHSFVADFEYALKNHNFRIYLQPQIVEGNKVCGAEALVRWSHPEFGMVSPGEFISLFESNGLIQQLDRYVWNEAAAQISRWNQQYGIWIPVSVNVSRVDIFDPQLREILQEITSRNGLPTEKLLLEITESAYTESADQLRETIHRLREKGYIIEMDDFGSGYSSLNMLSSMPIDVLKMDRAFILNIETSKKDFRLVELILDLARNLQVPVIAEGVETEQQLAMLKKAGCALVQGFYFSRPLSPDAFEKAVLGQKQ